MHQRAVLRAAIVAALLLSACASGPRAEPCVVDEEGICTEADTFPRYRACVMTLTGGRQLFDTGWVVGETSIIGDDGKPAKRYLFVSDRNPDDGKHAEPVARIKRPCNVAGGTEFDVERREP